MRRSFILSVVVSLCLFYHFIVYNLFLLNTNITHQLVTDARARQLRRSADWHEDADCPPNIQLFRGQNLCSCGHESLEQFTIRLTKSRLIILPVQAVADDIFIWTVRPRRIVKAINCAVYKYSYLLYLLTVIRK